MVNNLQGLNEFARRFAEYVSQEQPGLVSYLRVEQRGKPDGGVLVIQIPSPSGKPDDDLIVDTMGDEITVSWLAWHGHVGSYDAEESRMFRAALQYVHDIVDERQVLDMRMIDDRYCGGSMHLRGYGTGSLHQSPLGESD